MMMTDFNEKDAQQDMMPASDAATAAEPVTESAAEPASEPISADVPELTVDPVEAQRLIDEAEAAVRDVSVPEAPEMPFTAPETAQPENPFTAPAPEAPHPENPFTKPETPTYYQQTYYQPPQYTPPQQPYRPQQEQQASTPVEPPPATQQQAPNGQTYQPPRYTQQYPRSEQPNYYQQAQQAQQPYAQQQPYQQPYPNPAYYPQKAYTQKSRLAAGLLGILLGIFGVHNFYTGNIALGIVQLAITLLSCFTLSFVSAIWGLVEGIMILSGSRLVDGHGLPFRE